MIIFTKEYIFFTFKCFLCVYTISSSKFDVAGAFGKYFCKLLYLSQLLGKTKKKKNNEKMRKYIKRFLTKSKLFFFIAQGRCLTYNFRQNLIKNENW